MYLAAGGRLEIFNTEVTGDAHRGHIENNWTIHRQSNNLARIKLSVGS